MGDVVRSLFGKNVCALFTIIWSTMLREGMRDIYCPSVVVWVDGGLCVYNRIGVVDILGSLSPDVGPSDEQTTT